MRNLIQIFFFLSSLSVIGQHFVDFKYHNHCLNNIIYFSDSVVLNSSDKVASLTWDFGDGFTSYDRSPIHAFDREGEYEVTMQVITKMGNEFSLTKIVKINTPPLAFFYPEEICNDQINFVNESIDSSKHKAMWDFGDGNYSLSPNPVHRYEKEGKYKVSLKVMNELGCWDSTTKVVYVNELGHVVSPKYSVKISNADIVSVQKVYEDSLSSDMKFNLIDDEEDFKAYGIENCGDTIKVQFKSIEELIKKVGTQNGFANTIKRLELREKDGRLIYKLVGSIDAEFYKQWIALLKNREDQSLLFLIEYVTNNQLIIQQSGEIKP